MAQRATPLLFGGAVHQSTQSSSSSTAVRLDHYEHDPADFDYYVRNPTVEDLPVLLHKFDVENLEVWPWIWTHPNSNGPHYVFHGVTAETIIQIRQIRAASVQNNILIIADSASLEKAAVADPNVYSECHCGLVTDSTLQLLNAKAKILMLQDERVIAFDYLVIS